MKKFLKWQIIGGIIVAFLGTIWHFLYNLSGKNLLVALVSPVNESTWEHLKILFFPFLVFSIIEYFFIGKNIKNFVIAKALSIVVGMFLIIISFYTYTGIIGADFFIADIITFIVGVLGAVFTYGYIVKHQLFSEDFYKYIGIAIFVLFIVLFVIFTFTVITPQINLFHDPVKGGYGIFK